MRVRSDLRQGIFDFLGDEVYCNEDVSRRRFFIEPGCTGVGICLNLDVSMVDAFERKGIGNGYLNRFILTIILI